MIGSSLNSLRLAVAFPLLFLAPVELVAEPIRCAPCTLEKLLNCPAVPAGCEEVIREAGCGCCSTCALRKGDLCGVYTARCGAGLRCYPRETDPNPLQSLTRGLAICMEESEVARIQSSRNTEQSELPGNENTEDIPVSLDQHSVHYETMGHVTHDQLQDPNNVAELQDNMKTKLSTIRRKPTEMAPCRIELKKALEKISRSQKTGERVNWFHLPNCERHGFYHTKQCETSLDGQRGKCWCVFPWNGKRIPGSPEVRSDPECQQYLDLQE
ncbi:insulin-like growth factor-binding protein 1 [Polypterus senegalus]|uniref:insulin-like growth factor-binding protein 1 n=1 Tax=Polypterus senegalus TaxID=55291 RepID=UPI001963550A|nr:insulin-like growth factor-binding protein 1 [Polypterus senegalus]